MGHCLKWDRSYQCRASEVLRYDLAVNDEYLNEYAADRVMVATPPALLPIIFQPEVLLWPRQDVAMAVTPVFPYIKCQKHCPF